MKKVVWPSKKQTTRYSIIVIALSLGVAIFFGVLDYVFNIGLEAILSDGNTVNEEVETLPTETQIPDVDLGGFEVGEVDYQTKPAE